MKRKNLVLILIIITAFIFSCASAGKEDASEEVYDEIEYGVTVERKDTTEAEKSASGIKRESVEDGLFAGEIDAAPRVMESAAPGPSGTAPASPPATSGLKAGYADDNRQFGYFLNFLKEYGENVIPIDIDVSERITLQIRDKNGDSIPGAIVTVSADGNTVRGLSLADGSYQVNPAELFNPRERDRDILEITIEGGRTAPGFKNTTRVDRNGARTIEIKAGVERMLETPVPLDIVFVMDTTGSMGEEINRLKNTIQIIHMNLSALSVAADIRFGMVLYKDEGDDYTAMQIPLTSDLEIFQEALDQVEAYGGGDTPEDLEAALSELVNEMEWNPDAVKLSYVITDAPPHLDYERNYTTSDALRDAREKGIKIFTIGTGGLDLQGEYNLRQIAQYTSARYIFLTYGSETGESGGGAPGSVSHHTGSNWSADKLETIIIRFTREELSYLSDSPLLDEQPWFEADSIESEAAEDTLASLFNQALEQLLDFSTFSITDETLLAVLPFSYEGDIAADAEYFNEHLILAAGSSDRVKLAERKDIAQLLNEIEFQNLGLTNEESVARIGEFLNADILLGGNLFVKNGKFELFLKLMRVETSEVLSVTRAVIDSELGL